MKKKLIRPSAEEDAAITKAALSDPDNLPMTDEEWSEIKHRLVRGRTRPVVNRTNGKLIDNKPKDTA
ncbi:hypothetical protein [Polynucleobacter sp. MWH-UH35A]|uniref:hypothetical protein n=1 Tax=Polynucleobacter sp. MWH-UH35A TaxID=1855619 RepID=UPI001BFD841F|nr:hypothetical protein [Polynucleobacter sp. MWH-UH35A]QWD60744.1 hypothetical protein ICV36_03365 [Polynucleobacter sp. MWH-UH35A]